MTTRSEEHPTAAWEQVVVLEAQIKAREEAIFSEYFGDVATKAEVERLKGELIDAELERAVYHQKVGVLEQALEKIVAENALQASILAEYVKDDEGTPLVERLKVEREAYRDAWQESVSACGGLLLEAYRQRDEAKQEVEKLKGELDELGLELHEGQIREEVLKSEIEALEAVLGTCSAAPDRPAFVDLSKRVIEAEAALEKIVGPLRKSLKNQELVEANRASPCPECGKDRCSNVGHRDGYYEAGERVRQAKDMGLKAICDLLEAETIDPECLEHGEHPLSSDDLARYCCCAEKASEIVKNACGSRPDFPSGKDYVDEVRGHSVLSLEDRVREMLRPYVSDFDALISDIAALLEAEKK